MVDADDIRTPMKKIFEILIRANFIETVQPEQGMQSYGSDSTKQYEYHYGVGRHSIKKRTTFKANI